MRRWCGPRKLTCRGPPDCPELTYNKLQLKRCRFKPSMGVIERRPTPGERNTRSPSSPPAGRTASKKLFVPNTRPQKSWYTPCPHSGKFDPVCQFPSPGQAQDSYCFHRSQLTQRATWVHRNRQLLYTILFPTAIGRQDTISKVQQSLQVEEVFTISLYTTP